jgi:hypothetical protein
MNCARIFYDRATVSNRLYKCGNPVEHIDSKPAEHAFVIGRALRKSNQRPAVFRAVPRPWPGRSRAGRQYDLDVP